MERSLNKEAEEATQLLKNKIVEIVWRHRKDEVAIKFTDGTTLFVNIKDNYIDLSIT